MAPARVSSPPYRPGVMDGSDLALRKGFVEIEGSGWRRQRRDAPLFNTYRSYCDALAQPAIFLFKEKDGQDSLFVDLSPLRAPKKDMEAVARDCIDALHSKSPENAVADRLCIVGAFGNEGDSGAALPHEENRSDGASVAAREKAMGECDEEDEELSFNDGARSDGDGAPSAEDEDDMWRRLPIYRIPMFCMECSPIGRSEV